MKVPSLLLLTAWVARGAHAAAVNGRMTFSLRATALEAQAESLGMGKETPVQRVVKLLQEMKAQLEKEASSDSEAYDKMVCWCETNDKAKTKAIADADSKITELQSEVESRSSRGGELTVKIAALKKELAEKKAALDEATSIREKEHGAFNAREQEMVQAVTMLKNAILVLSRHNAGLLQMTPGVQESLGAALRWAALKHEEMMEMSTENGSVLQTVQPPSAASLLSMNARSLRADSSGAAAENNAASTAMDEALMRAMRGTRASVPSIPAQFAARVLAKAAQGTSLTQQGGPAHLQSYAPQSGQIFGILRTMKEEFEASLSDEQKEELKAQEEYSELKAASEKQIAASTVLLDEMEEDFGGNSKALSDAKEDLGVTQDTRGSDVQFLSDLRLKCQALDHDWKKRSESRNEEVTAVAQTIAILTEDDARDLFHKKLGTGASASLLQVQQRSRVAMKVARTRASSILMQTARRMSAGKQPDVASLYTAWHSTEDRPHEQLAAMAVRVQLDAFSKVKKAIDDMVAELKSQQDEEVKHKASCTQELNDNEKMTYKTQQDLEAVTDKIGSLEATIQKMTEGITAAKEEIKSMEVEIKKASEVRESENKNFQEEVTDQRAMQNILKKAAARMRMVYKKQEALAQQDPEPPVKFQPYKQNVGAAGVVGMLEAIVKDSEALEAEAVAGEQESQKAYEVMVKDSNEAIKQLNAAIEEKTDTKAGSEVDKEEAEVQKKSTETSLEDLGQVAGDLHAQCDFVLKNFDIRQKARLDEIEALQGAKALLSGMSAEDDSQ